ncbi:hypothetical protein GDO81_025012, partial [Engystomops pustulosus]
MEDLEGEGVAPGSSGGGTVQRACGTPLILESSENGSLSNVSYATDGSGTVTSDDSELVLTESSTEALASRSRGGSSTSRDGTRRRSLAGKIQQLLTPSRKPSRSSLLRKTGSMSEAPSPLVYEQHHGKWSHRESSRRPESTASESSVSLGSEADSSDTSVCNFAIHKSTERLLDGGQEVPAVEVLLSSCSQCPACHSLIYDEDIMAGWTSDDSNLKTICSFCGQHFVPSLNVKITDLLRARRAEDPPEVTVDGGAVSRGPVLSDRYHCLVLDEDASAAPCNGFPDVQHSASDLSSEVVTVAYLCPLVLRKEMESLLENEGGDFLSQPELVDNHPIIYWNLVWYFQRLALPSNLLLLILASKHVQTSVQ